MKNIEIKTTQNVVLEYELADLRDRAVAFFLDFVCLIVAIWILAFAGFSLIGNSRSFELFYLIFLWCVFIFYSPVMEIFNHGQSLGKMIMKIQVIKTVGGRATFSDYAARWVFRMIDIYLSLGGIASILVASSSKAQRIGDIVANTAVVKKTPKLNLKLKDLLSIHSNTNYTPIYQQARQLDEKDALLIKSALDRYRKFNNDAHKEAIQMLAGRIKQLLTVDKGTLTDVKFLQTILNDYVVLTR